MRSLNLTVKVTVTTPVAPDELLTVNGPGVTPKFCSVVASVRSMAFSVGNENGLGVASARGAYNGNG